MCTITLTTQDTKLKFAGCITPLIPELKRQRQVDGWISVSSRPAWSTKLIPGQPGLLCLKKTKKQSTKTQILLCVLCSLLFLWFQPNTVHITGTHSPFCKPSLNLGARFLIQFQSFKGHFIFTLLHLPGEGTCMEVRGQPEGFILSCRFWNQTQVIRFSVNCLYPLSHPEGPPPFFSLMLLCACMHERVVANMWRSGENFVEFKLSSHTYVGSRMNLDHQGCVIFTFTCWAILQAPGLVSCPVSSCPPAPSVFLYRVSLCSFGVCPGTRSVCRPGWPRTQEIRLPLPLSAGIKGVYHHRQVWFQFLFLKLELINI